MGYQNKSLVLGLAFGYKWISVTVFVRSLRSCGYTGDLALFVGETNSRTYRELKKHEVELIPIRLKHPYHESLVGCRGPDLGHLETSSPHVQRYAMYLMYLHRVRHRYDAVMLADVKDVLFQRDPFDFDMGGARICFFEEEPSRAIRDCSLNSQWISEPFGNATLDQIGGNPIVCSGTSIGTSEAIFDYCGTMLDCMSRHRITGPGGDQGAHNFLIYTHKIDGMRIFPNEEGPILTLATRIGKPQFDSEGNMVNVHGKVPNTIHQYDRFPEIMEKVNARYLDLWQRLWVSLARTKSKLRSVRRNMILI
jgi:hypothetical protein